VQVIELAAFLCEQGGGTITSMLITSSDNFLFLLIDAAFSFGQRILPKARNRHLVILGKIIQNSAAMVKDRGKRAGNQAHCLVFSRLRSLLGLSDPQNQYYMGYQTQVTTVILSSWARRH
jgi:hypothetical protein